MLLCPCISTRFWRRCAANGEYLCLRFRLPERRFLCAGQNRVKSSLSFFAVLAPLSCRSRTGTSLPKISIRLVASKYSNRAFVVVSSSSSNFDDRRFKSSDELCLRLIELQKSNELRRLDFYRNDARPTWKRIFLKF
jgi:hypothetical protein